MQKISFIRSARFGLIGCILASGQAVANDAETAFGQELASCAAYYDIASLTIASMNAPQMKAVGKKLKASGQEIIGIAKNYASAEQVNANVNKAKAEQLTSLDSSGNLGGLMQKYREPCKQIIADPQKRLDYWVMVTM